MSINLNFNCYTLINKKQDDLIKYNEYLTGIIKMEPTPNLPSNPQINRVCYDLLENEVEIIRNKYNNNFSTFAFSDQLRVGYWSVDCLFCMESFNVFENKYLKGVISLCCDGFNYCGECLASVDLKTFKKFKDGNICLCFKSLNSMSHCMTQGPEILDLEISHCMDCKPGSKKMLESPHYAEINYGNTGLPEFVKEHRTPLAIELNSLKTTRGRHDSILSYGMTYSYFENTPVWNSSTQNYTFEAKQVNMPLPSCQTECWVLQGPTDPTDPDRYLYNRFGERVYFVTRPFPNDLNEEHFLPIYDKVTPKISWTQFMLLDPTLIGMHKSTSIHAHYYIEDKWKCLARDCILEHKKKKLKFFKKQNIIDYGIAEEPPLAEESLAIQGTRDTRNPRGGPRSPLDTLGDLAESPQMVEDIASAEGSLASSSTREGKRGKEEKGPWEGSLGVKNQESNLFTLDEVTKKRDFIPIDIVNSILLESQQTLESKLEFTSPYLEASPFSLYLTEDDVKRSLLPLAEEPLDNPRSLSPLASLANPRESLAIQGTRNREGPRPLSLADTRNPREGPGVLKKSLNLNFFDFLEVVKSKLYASINEEYDFVEEKQFCLDMDFATPMLTKKKRKSKYKNSHLD